METDLPNWKRRAKWPFRIGKSQQNGPSELEKTPTEWTEFENGWKRTFRMGKTGQIGPSEL
jgi:hypothetical protein